MISWAFGSKEQEYATRSLVPTEPSEDTPMNNVIEDEYSFVDVEPSMWGIGVCEIINNVEIFLRGNGEINSVVILRGLLIVTLMMVNVALQFILLYDVYFYIVLPASVVAQQNYQQYHKEIFLRNGSFNHTAWKSWDGPKEEICSSAVSKFLFTFTIIFLWSTVMVGELRKTERLFRNVKGLRDKPDYDGSTMLEKTYKENTRELEAVYIQSLSWRTRHAIYVFIIVPKAFIGLFLLWLGCRWLAATEDFKGLILNAIALEFIISIDEIVYDVFFPDQDKKVHGCHKIMLDKIAAASGQVVNREQRLAYCRSYFVVFIAAGFAFAYICFLQQVLPGYSPFLGDIQAHCREMFTLKASCGITWTEWAHGLFYPSKYTSGLECFPYGPGQGHSTLRELSLTVPVLNTTMRGSTTTVSGLNLRGGR